MTKVQIKYHYEHNSELLVFIDEEAQYIPQIGDIVEFDEPYIVDKIERKAINYNFSYTTIYAWYFDIYLKRKKDVNNTNIE